MGASPYTVHAAQAVMFLEPRITQAIVFTPIVFQEQETMMDVSVLHCQP